MKCALGFTPNQGYYRVSYLMYKLTKDYLNTSSTCPTRLKEWTPLLNRGFGKIVSLLMGKTGKNSSMQTCSLHIQTMAEERAILKNSVISTVIGCHLSKSVNQISSARADHARPFTVKLKGLVKRKTASPPLCVYVSKCFILFISLQFIKEQHIILFNYSS